MPNFDWSDILTNLALGTLVVSTLSVALSSLLRRIVVGYDFASYRVAVLGPPRSGKTTSIMALLDQVGRDPVSGIARLRGETTIRSVEHARQQLNLAKFPEPTREDESFVYRFDFSVGPSILVRLFRAFASVPVQYRVEIADFAGEHTELFFSKGKDEISNIPREYSISTDVNFIKWIAESNKCLIYIDCAEYLARPDIYPGEISAKYMAFWDRYLDLIPTSLSRRGGPPVVLVFTKIDLVVSGSSDDASSVAVQMLAEKFQPLIQYLDQQSRKLSIEAISVLMKESDGEFVGVSDLVRSVLPLRYEGGRRTTEGERGGILDEGLVLE